MGVITTLLAIGVALGINGIFANIASGFAEDKGYEKWKWFHMCFWLGFLSYILIAAMPDRRLRDQQDETNKLLKELIEVQKKSNDHEAVAEKNSDSSDSYLPEL